MNSLTYLSRQFDVLASPRTPPSTPTLENVPLLEGDEFSGTLKRVQTWSQKSFLVTTPSSSSSTPWSLRRSHSSPAEVNAGEPSTSSAPPMAARTPSLPSCSRPSSRRPSVSLSEKGIRPVSAAESLWSRMFFVRALISLWHYMCALWNSMTVKIAQQSAHSTAVEDVSDEDEKDTEDESNDQQPVAIQVQQAPPTPPPLPLPVTTLPSISRNNTDPGVIYLDVNPRISPEGSSSSLPSSTSSTLPPRAEEVSRAAAPISANRKTALHLNKTLVLDLDETLIHSTSRPIYSAHSGSGILSRLGFGRRNKGAGHTVEVVLGGRSTLYHVYKRPFVDYFLRKVSTWYTLVIFTASMQEYADPVIDWLDAGRGIIHRRFFRESCTQLPNGSYTKDLSIIEQDLSRVCLVDNSPICYSINEANGIPIEGWTNDPHDEALLDLLPVLDSLRFTKDVRHVLGIRGFS